MNLKEISILVITETIPIRIRYTFRLPKDISILATTQKPIHMTALGEGFIIRPPPPAPMFVIVTRQEERSTQTRRTVLKSASTTRDEPMM